MKREKRIITAWNYNIIQQKEQAVVSTPPLSGPGHVTCIPFESSDVVQQEIDESGKTFITIIEQGGVPPPPAGVTGDSHS